MRASTNPIGDPAVEFCHVLRFVFFFVCVGEAARVFRVIQPVLTVQTPLANLSHFLDFYNISILLQGTMLNIIQGVSIDYTHPSFFRFHHIKANQYNFSA